MVIGEFGWYNGWRRGDLMIEALVACVLRAHKTMRAHMVAVWFPALFSVALFVVFLLVAVILILPIVPDILTSPNPAALASPAVLRALFPRLLFLLALAIPLTVASDAGTLYIQAQAVKGQPVDTGYFFLGIRKLSWRLVAGRAIEILLYLLLFTPLLVSMVMRVMRLTGPEGNLLLAPEEPIFRAFMDLLPLALLSGLMYIAVGVLMSMWSRVLALRELPLARALIAGILVARAHFLAILLMFIAQWVLSTALQRLLGQEALGSLIGIGLGYILRVYAGMTLMHLYELRTAAVKQQVENGG
ncbi:MAG: hypothetical protein DDT37_01472 [Firmicutes bacterium]|nr:hypothetical protein [candidate division NPL-UPA2 bacterium]